MFWQELNNKRTRQLQQWLQNKSVIVVGNSVRMMEQEYGELIDSYDVVVRLGKGLTEPRLYANIGSKTHVWFSGMLRAGMYKHVDCPWKILTLSSSSMFDPHTPFVPLNKVLFQDDFQPYRNYFWAESIEGTRQHWIGLGFDKDNRPSQGLICVDWLCRLVQHTSFDVIGFDFFEAKITVNNTEYTSWHMPRKVTTEQEVAHSNQLEKQTMHSLQHKYGFKLLSYFNHTSNQVSTPT